VTVKELDSAPVLDPKSDKDELVFGVGEFETTFTREELDALDVRDKDDLAARRRARARDLLLWRIFLGSAAAIAFALILEVGVVGGKLWQKGRVTIVNARAPEVAKIEKQNELATTIEELSTKRLLPFEMIELVKTKRPDSVVFTRIATTSDSIYTLDIKGQTTISNDVVSYQALLNGMPECQEVKIVDQRITGGLSVFQLQITFKPESVQPEVQS
jgi:hypothetical protein